MRLATLRDGTRDGALVVVRSDGAAYARADRVAPSLQAALDRWPELEPALQRLADGLETVSVPAEPLQARDLDAPLPRAYEWVDGSAYLSHVRLVRRARGASIPASLEEDPLVYQGGSGVLLGPTDDLFLGDPAWGLDFEAEVCVVLADTRQGTTRAEAANGVRLLALANDVTLRNLIPSELAKGFGFFQSKPARAFSPFAVTPDELGPAWRDGRLHLRMRCVYNGQPIGEVDAGAGMHFSFFDLVEHIAKTRSFTAGTLLGGGTVSSEDRSQGVSCLAERRMIEAVDQGQPLTPFMQVGDTIEIEMRDAAGRSVFGRIDQRVVGP